MLKNLALIAMTLLLIAGCSGDNTDQAAADHGHDHDGHTHAQDADHPAQLTIAEFNKDGEAYEGKLVEIVGTVDHVCKHSGKRIFIHGDNAEDRVKVEAGEVGTFDVPWKAARSRSWPWAPS